MSTLIPKENSKVILNSPQDWEQWHTDFKSMAIMCKVWDYIQGKTTLLLEPIRPPFEDFAVKRTAAVTRSHSAGPSRQRTSTTTTQEETQQDSSETLTLGPETTGSVSRDIPPSTRPLAFKDLTAEAQRAYQGAWTIYQHDTKTYKDQEDHIYKFKEWLMTSISPHYRQTCLEPTESLLKWYKNLKDAAGLDTYIETNNARRQYRDALKPPRNLKEFGKCIDNWEKAMSIAFSKNIAVTKTAVEWFSDLIGTLEKILPSWSEAYELTRTQEVEKNTLAYRTVANDLRKVLEKERHKGWKLAKGSFGPTFAGEADQYAAAESPPDAEDSTGVSAKRRARDDGRGIEAKRRKREEASRDEEASSTNPTSRDQRKDSSEARRVCRGCEGFHSTKKCYYLLPDQAPEGWTPRTHTQRIVDRNLKKDSSLRKDLERWMEDLKEKNQD